ncbi:MAG: flagellar basal body P-ring formation chaperone FlgA [Alphaproteobacteria bacterium]
MTVRRARLSVARLNQVILIAIGIIAAAMAPAKAASEIVVRDDVIRIGDIFPNAGDQAETIVLRAPAPGERTHLDARWLAQAARAYGITWHPADRDGGLTVERASEVVAPGIIGKALGTALAKLAGAGNAELGGRPPEIHLVAGTTPKIDIEDLKFEWDTRRFSATIAVSAADQRVRRARVSGYYYESVRLPVLRRPVTAGEIISAADIELVSIRGRRLPADAVHDAELAIGKAARRTLRTGEPIRVTDIQQPMLVVKKSLITLMVQSPYLTITTQGRALEDGVLGDTVQATNIKSGKTVVGVITGPDTVLVRSDAPVALSSASN